MSAASEGAISAEGGRGPLSGVRVVEIAGTVPGSFTSMLLGDLGADVLRVDRAPLGPDGRALPGASAIPVDLFGRGHHAISADLKSPQVAELLLDLFEHTDVVIEGFRPGVVERLGIGPDESLARNPRLVFGRLTGWGQEGPLAPVAGHDINYIAVAGVLHGIGRAGSKPVVPGNVIGDFAGGGLLLALGIVAALFERADSGQGQVIDAAMVDGVAALSTFVHSMRYGSNWEDERGTNVVDGGAPFYDTYETSDGRYVAIGAVEPKFYGELVRRMSLDLDPAAQYDPNAWPAARAAFTAAFRTKTRDEWCDLLEGVDVCFAPVLTTEEAWAHPHNRHRETFVEVDGLAQPAPAPRFSRTTLAAPGSLPPKETRGIGPLAEWGVDQALIDAAHKSGGLAE